VNSSVPAYRSQPSLRAAPVLHPPGLSTAGIAVQKTEPTLVILCQFDDRDSTTSRTAWDAPMFGPYVIGGRSHRDYYREVSYYIAGAQGLDLPPAAEACGNNDGIAGWYTISYTNPNSGAVTGNHPYNAVGVNWKNVAGASNNVAAGAIAAADNDVNFAAFDLNGDTFISASELHIIIILAGYEASWGANPGPDTPRHHWSLGAGVVLDGVTLLQWNMGGGYSMCGELDKNGNMIEYGLICHETGHDLGLPDLYDTSQNSEGVGEWSLMGSGDWCNTAVPGDCPAHLDPWCKSWLFWVVPVNVGVDMVGVNIVQVETNPVVYKLWNHGAANMEYFLVENRQRVGYDQGLVRTGQADGLIIWHVNYARESWGNEEEHQKFIDVECADATLAAHVADADDLDTKKNRGDATDPWYQGNDADFYTSSVPDNRDYRNHPTFNFNSSVEVRNASASGNPMTADLRVGRTTYIGVATYTANGQSANFGMLAANSFMRVYYLGNDCCGNTYIYERDNTNAWAKVRTWNYNVPRHANFVAGNEVRQVQAQWTGQFQIASYSLGGTACDGVGIDPGFDVEVYDNGVFGLISPGNAELYPGWNAGFRDGLGSEFGSIGGTDWSFAPDVDGLRLTQFPRREGMSGVQNLHLMSTLLPNVYWERVRLQFTVADVTRPGTLTISCPYAQYPTRMVNITGPGEYQAELGWVRPPGPYPTSIEVTLSVAAGPIGADFGWDWLNLGTMVAPLSLISPLDGLITTDNTPTFDWSDLVNPVSYQVQADDDANFSSPVLDQYLTMSNYTPSSPIGDGFYYWRARGSTVFGGVSAWSGPEGFRIDTQPPGFAGTTLWSDTSFSGPYPVASTVTDLGARVDSVLLYYRFNGGGWTSVRMPLVGLGGDQYEEAIVGAPGGAVIDYYLRAWDFAGNVTTDPPGAPGSYYSFRRTGEVEPGLETPRAVLLMQSRPNPFWKSAEIRYGLPRECMVSLEVFDLNGRKIATLASGRQGPGYKSVFWDGRGKSGNRFPSGVYLYRLQAGNVVLKQKLVLMH
jgi:M6 family metalloprotease-like protein